MQTIVNVACSAGLLASVTINEYVVGGGGNVPGCMPLIFTYPGLASGDGETMGVTPWTVAAEMLYGAVPPVISSLAVAPLHAAMGCDLGAAVSGDTGVVGVPVPTTLIRVAVVCRPVASRMVNISGSTQEPLVIAEKGSPDAATVVLSRFTAFGNVD